MEIPFRDPVALAAFARPFIVGELAPSTAAELMASRYVAYTTGNIDYLLDTNAPETRHTIDRKATEAWARASEWLGLEIVKTEAGGSGDQAGQVEFIARYKLDGVEQAHHELSDFKKIEGRWFFVDGKLVNEQPLRRSAPKVGRNDPCPCGSGKKYKKCCG